DPVRFGIKPRMTRAAASPFHRSDLQHAPKIISNARLVVSCPKSILAGRACVSPATPALHPAHAGHGKIAGTSSEGMVVFLFAAVPVFARGSGCSLLTPSLEKR